LLLSRAWRIPDAIVSSVETKEQLGGFYLIECDNLDQAIDAASRIPGIDRGVIEVRPVVEH